MTEEESPKSTRRKFLFGWRRTVDDLDINPVIESDAKDKADNFIKRLEDIKVSRRTILAASTAAGGALVLEKGLNGLPSALIGQFLQDPEAFLNKVGEKLEEGTIIEEIGQAVESRVGSHGRVELGERLDLREDLLNDCFDEYTVREYIKNGENTGNLLLIATPGRVAPVTAHYDYFVEGGRLGMPNFTRTAAENGPFITLPSNQVDRDSEQNTYVPYLYSAYMTENGPFEYFEKDGQRRPRGGGLVVQRGQLRVVGAEELSNIKIGENAVEAIETFAFTIDSDKKAEDLIDIDNTEVLSGAKLADSPRYDSVIVTFQKSSGEYISKVVSTYQHLDNETYNTEGDVWDSNERMTLIQATGICEQIMQEEGFDRFIIAVPDPEEQSRLVGSEAYERNDVQDMRNAGHFLRVPTQPFSGEEYGHKIHRTIGMEYPVDKVVARPHFLASFKS